MRPDSAATVVFLTALVAIGPMATALYLSSLPTRVGVFATDIGTVPLTLTVQIAAFDAKPPRLIAA